MNINEVKEKANYCLNCKTKPCALKGCPINTNIPEFIQEIKNGNFEKAYDILHENNICSYICGLVCPQEEQCEGSCVRAVKSFPTNIGKLEVFVNNWAKANDYTCEITKKESNGKKVAIVGSGPAGIACATDLLKEGFAVDIYEKEKFAGGILTYGIPDFRLKKELVNDVISKLEKLGAEFFFEKELGKDINIAELSNKYDYVFLGIGAPKSSKYSLAEEKCENIYDSDYFLKKYYEKDFIKDLGTVVVIGGGNVAMDVARVAVKMGAKKVKILYRRDRAHMPAREIELEEALADGVEFNELTRVQSANIENGKMNFVTCIRTEIFEGKAIDKEPEEKFEEEANTVVFAIGLKPDKDLIVNQGLELDDWGYIKIDEKGKTNIKNVYAGGDISESKATVCKALAAGKKVAKEILKNIK